jgi:hypothetical protein
MLQHPHTAIRLAELHRNDLMAEAERRRAVPARPRQAQRTSGLARLLSPQRRALDAGNGAATSLAS